MKRLILALSALALVHAPTSVANQIRDLGIEKTIQLSDVVIVGTLDDSETPPAQGAAMPERVRVRVLYVIKGKAPDVIVLDRAVDFPEGQIACCEPGARYLLFLVRGTTGRYMSVNGMYGVHKLDEPRN